MNIPTEHLDASKALERLAAQHNVRQSDLNCCARLAECGTYDYYRKQGRTHDNAAQLGRKAGDAYRLNLQQ